MNFKTHKNKTKSKFERVMAISVSQGKMKSLFLKILKFWNLAKFLRFLPNFLHLSSIYKYFQLMYSNMGPKATPFLISKGGIRYLPPPGVGRNQHPLGNRVKAFGSRHSIYVLKGCYDNTLQTSTYKIDS